MRTALLAVVGLALVLGGKPADALRQPGAPRCPVFPASNAWNQRVDTLPVVKIEAGRQSLSASPAPRSRSSTPAECPR